MKLDTAPVQINPALLTPTATIKAGATKDLDMKKIDETAKDFEAMFMSEMLKPIFDTVQTDEQFGGGKGEDMWRGFLRDEYAKNMSANGSLGIADLVKQQLIETQSKALAPKMAQNMQGNPTEVTGDTNV